MGVRMLLDHLSVAVTVTLRAEPMSLQHPVLSEPSLLPSGPHSPQNS